MGEIVGNGHNAVSAFARIRNEEFLGLNALDLPNCFHR